MDPIDLLLAEVQAEYQEPKTSNRPQNLQNLQNLLSCSAFKLG